VLSHEGCDKEQCPKAVFPNEGGDGVEVLFVFCILILKIYLCARLGTDFHNSETGAG
jgi:hypothetical protein